MHALIKHNMHNIMHKYTQSNCSFQGFLFRNCMNCSASLWEYLGLKATLEFFKSSPSCIIKLQSITGYHWLALSTPSSGCNYGCKSLQVSAWDLETQVLWCGVVWGHLEHIQHAILMLRWDIYQLTYMCCVNRAL